MVGSGSEIVTLLPLSQKISWFEYFVSSEATSAGAPFFGSTIYINLHKSAISIAYKQIRTSMLTGPVHFGVLSFGNSHGLKALIARGIVTQVVRATLIEFPTKFARAAEGKSRNCGFRNLISNMTIGKSPRRISVAVFQLGGPLLPLAD